LPLLLEICKVLNELNCFDFDVAILGKGPQENNLKHMCSILGLDNKVYWSGTTLNVANFYDDLDLFILTSNYEGFGLVLLEAMSHGIPIVARSVSSIPEVLGFDHKGLITSTDANVFACKIAEILSSTYTYESLCSYQKTRLLLFDIANSHQKHENLYAALSRSRIN